MFDPKDLDHIRMKITLDQAIKYGRTQNHYDSYLWQKKLIAILKCKYDKNCDHYEIKNVQD